MQSKLIKSNNSRLKIIFLGVIVYYACLAWIQYSWTMLAIASGLLSLVLTIYDKRRAIRYSPHQAKNGFAYRVPEKWFYILALLGGWPIAEWAQQLLRHKTIKTSFRYRHHFMAVLNIMMTIVIGWYYGKWIILFDYLKNFLKL